MNIEDLIAAANPMPAQTIPTADSPQARQTLAQILGSRRNHGRLRQGALGSRPGLLLGGLAVVGAAGLVLALLVPGPAARPHQPGPHQPAMAAALDALAVVAAAAPVAHPPRPGQFEYTDEKSLNWVDTFNGPKDSYSVSYIERRQAWIGPDGSGRIKESYVDPDLPPQDRAGWIAAGRPSLRIAPSDQRFGPHQLSPGPTNLLKLPTNPTKLAALLFARRIEGGPTGSAEDFVQIGDLLRETYAPPALRAAIFKVAERIGGAKLLGTVTDPAGQSGIAIAHWRRFAAHGQMLGQVDESVLIFDPKTSALTAEETFVTYVKTHKTVLTSWTAYLKSGVVNSVTSTTPGSGPGTGTPGPA